MVANKPLQNYSVSKGKDELVCQQPSLRLDFPGGSDGKASVYNAGDLGSIPGREDPLEKEMATHSRTIALKIP